MALVTAIGWGLLGTAGIALLFFYTVIAIGLVKFTDHYLIGGGMLALIPFVMIASGAYYIGRD